MAKLYVANLSKQDHIFTYRLPEAANARPQPIPAGSQVIITGGDLPEESVRIIVDQNARYGLLSVSQIKNAREFVGLCYDIDRPVKLSVFEERLGTEKNPRGKNDEALDKAAGERLQETTAAIGEMISEKVGRPVTRTEVEQVDTSSGTPTIATGVEVVREGVAPRHAGKQGRGRQRNN